MGDDLLRRLRDGNYHYSMYGVYLMGDKWSVFVWRLGGTGEYGYVPSYRGPSLVRALWDFYLCQRDPDNHCMKIEYRGGF